MIAVPPLTYSYALSLLDVMPEKPEVMIIPEQELKDRWAENEPNTSLSNFNFITPYWLL